VARRFELSLGPQDLQAFAVYEKPVKKRFNGLLGGFARVETDKGASLPVDHFHGLDLSKGQQVVLQGLLVDSVIGHSSDEQGSDVQVFRRGGQVRLFDLVKDFLGHWVVDAVIAILDPMLDRALSFLKTLEVFF